MNRPTVRQVAQVGRRLGANAALTAAEYRSRIANRDDPFESLADRFWDVLEMVRQESGGSLQTPTWIATKFRGFYQQNYHRPAPRIFVLDAVTVFPRIWALRLRSRVRLAKLSEIARRTFVDGDSSAVATMVRINGVEELWVREVIASLRAEQVRSDATPAERDIATRVLKSIGDSLWKLGKGRTAELQPSERASVDRQSRRDESRKVAQAAGRYLMNYNKLLKRDPWWTPERATKEVEDKARESRLEQRIRERALKAFRRRVDKERSRQN